ncbi:exodeoxyribonuclease III [Variovorax sp. H27-G14]|uniref:exodeoxyribonuclease III n=1 Tax=Variovorax sp. H27-G14 TaxID=3111914 RepID=UPI0038FCBC12
MRVATYNINNVVARLPQLRAWLEVTKPDVVCLQELKCVESNFPYEELAALGYEALVQGQKTWNGVAILARGFTPLEIRRQLPGDAADKQSRYLEAAVNGIVVACLYLPNGNPWPGPKFDYKMAWFDRLHSHASTLIRSGHPVVLAGDFNVVPTDDDIYSPASWKDNALLQPEPRAAFGKLMKQGWTDALKPKRGQATPYTYWSYLRNRWPRDAGLRIDHLLVSKALLPRLVSAGVDKAARGLEGASDHAPAWIELDHPA